jgi:hypothetical protein
MAQEVRRGCFHTLTFHSSRYGSVTLSVEAETTTAHLRSDRRITGSGTVRVTTISGYFRRVCDALEAMVTFSLGDLVSSVAGYELQPCSVVQTRGSLRPSKRLVEFGGGDQS